MDRLAVELLSTGGLACGLSAAALYALAKPPAIPSVWVERGRRTAINGRHTSRDLPDYERVLVGGLRCLSPMRTVLDSVHRLPPSQAVGLVESAIVRGLVRPLALQRRAKELSHSKRPGCAVTLRILSDLNPELDRSRNAWEALVARRVRQYGLPAPRLEFEVHLNGRRYFADAAWPDQRVLLEFEGRDPHMRRSVHDNDNGRRNDFTDQGWSRFGITATELKQPNGRTFALVARAIASR